MKRTLFLLLLLPLSLFAQKAYFIDGYHGGVYGHYPRWQTQFMVDQLTKHPDWKINLEIEPETWDSVKVYDPAAYQNFKNSLNTPAIAERIEFVNPAYGQPYLYNISGESIIRQFEYGIRETNEHFPSVRFSTYSSEEPCFTSALPQILKSFGFKYASLKNPNTCWGGYTRAFKGELIHWTGPDGTQIKTVSRYAVEALEEGSTWQTTAWANSEDYINACLQSGIEHPVGMCLQDAGWKGGPWLGIAKNTYRPSVYKTWLDYFENVAIEEPDANWNFSQEDMLVSLMWGSQVLQKLTQQIRVSENKIVMAEKLAALSSMYNPMSWPKADLDEAWRTLLLAQHHDCWIVPYNGKNNNTWADKVVSWTENTNRTSDSIMQLAMRNLANRHEANSNATYIRVFNTLITPRDEVVSVDIPENWNDAEVTVLDLNNKKVPSQWVINPETTKEALTFSAEAPSMGYATYKLIKGKPARTKGANVKLKKDGTYAIETDLYKIILDPEKGGSIKSLIAKELGSKEYVDHNNERSFNEIRGFFYDKGQFYSNIDNKATVNIIENGPLMVRLEIKGKIDVHPYTQILTVRQGDKKIDFDLNIEWQGNPGIGKYSQAKGYEAKDPEKAFYNDKYKLLTLFPLNLKSQKVYKNAPFDVTESKLDNTFFNRWDSIKHNVILNWVDVTDASGDHGLALFTDHTTSYAHGTDHPLALNLQYSGKGLWGRDYKITGPLQVRYAIVPHSNKWDAAVIWTESTKWNEPLVAAISDTPPAKQDWNKSLVEITGGGWEATTMLYDEGKLVLRLFNAEGDGEAKRILFDGHIQKAELIKLDGQVLKDLEVREEGVRGSSIPLAIPRFGFSVVRLSFGN